MYEHTHRRSTVEETEQANRSRNTVRSKDQARQAALQNEPIGDGRSVRNRRDHANALQHTVGNLTIQNEAMTSRSSSGTAGESTDQLEATVAGTGRRLRSSERGPMESRFGHHFGHVRLHDRDDAATSTRDFNAAGYTVGSDIVVRPDVYDSETVKGQLLLAHELAHIVQHDRRGTADRHSISRKTDSAEREAASAAEAVVAGESVQVNARPTAPVSTGVLDWLEDKAELVESGLSSTWGATKRGAGAVTGAVQSGLSTTWDVTKGVGSEIVARAREHGPLGMIYEGMKENAGYVGQGGEWLENKIDVGQDWLAEKAHSAAGLAEGIPVLEQLASGAATGLDWSTQITAGALQGATTFGSGVIGMAANPVDTARGLFALGEQLPVFPGNVANPLKMLRGAYDVATGQAGFGETLNRVFNPIETTRESMEFGGRLVEGFTESYRRSIGDDNDYGQAVGRAGSDILSLLLGGSGAVAKGTTTGVRVATGAARTGTRAATTSTRAASKSSSGWIKHAGQDIRRTPHGWRNRQGEFAKGPTSPSSAGGVSKSTLRKQAQRELMERTLTDPNAPKWMKGWIKNQKKQKQASHYKNAPPGVKKKSHQKNPPGYDVGHPPGKPMATHGNKGQTAWELRIDNQSRAHLAKLQKRLKNDPNYTREQFLKDVKEQVNFGGKKPNLP